jgi:hypothetical protein
MYTKEALPNQYTPAQPVDSTSPIHGGDAQVDRTERLDLKSAIQRHSSQIELVTRELKRTQTRVRELESQIQQVMAVLRRSL